MKPFILSFLIFLCINSYAQQSIKLENVRDHVGDSVKLKALIYGGKYLQSIKGSPTFLNVGAQYPDEVLTLVI